MGIGISAPAEELVVLPYLNTDSVGMVHLATREQVETQDNSVTTVDAGGSYQNLADDADLYDFLISSVGFDIAPSREGDNPISETVNVGTGGDITTKAQVDQNNILNASITNSLGSTLDVDVMFFATIIESESVGTGAAFDGFAEDPF